LLSEQSVRGVDNVPSGQRTFAYTETDQAVLISVDWQSDGTFDEFRMPHWERGLATSIVIDDDDDDEPDWSVEYRYDAANRLVWEGVDENADGLPDSYEAHEYNDHGWLSRTVFVRGHPEGEARFGYGGSGELLVSWQGPFTRRSFANCPRVP
jgi:hypothetical protein